MGKIGKIIVIIIALVYIISPVDCVPGPIDDVMVALAGIIVSKKIGDNG